MSHFAAFCEDDSYAQQLEAAITETPVEELERQESGPLEDAARQALHRMEAARNGDGDLAAAEADYDLAVAALGEAAIDSQISLAELCGDFAQENDYEHEIRREVLEAMSRFVLKDGAENLAAGFKNFLALARRIRPDLLKGMSAAQVGRLLGETRATVNEREQRLIEDFLKSNGAKGFKTAGGSKSEKSRRRSSKKAKNNSSRRGASRKKRLSERRVA